jgi:hypothetical protein
MDTSIEKLMGERHDLIDRVCMEIITIEKDRKHAKEK